MNETVPNDKIMDTFLKWCEEMSIPPDVLPKNPKSLFKNSEEAAVWTDIMSVIKPRYEIKNMKCNILIKSTKNYQQCVTNKVPDEIIKAQRIKNLKTKLKEAKSKLLQTQQKIHSVIVKKNAEEVKSSKLSAETEENNLKRSICELKTQEMLSEIRDIRQINDVLKAMKPTVSEANQNHANKVTTKKDIFHCLKEVKAFSILRENKEKEENEDDITDKIRVFTSDVPALQLWSLVNEICKEYSDEMHVMVSGINLKADEDKIVTEGKPLEHSLIELSAEHIQSWGRSTAYKLQIIRHCEKSEKILNNGLSLGDIVTLRGSESNIQLKSDTAEYMSCLLKNIKLAAAVAAFKKDIDRIQSETNKLKCYNNEFSNIIENIKNNDIKIEEMVEKIKRYSSTVQSAADRLNNFKDINNEKFAELIINSQLVLENSVRINLVQEDNSLRNIHCSNVIDLPSYLPEIEYFGKINITDLSKININNEEKRHKLFVNSFNCKQLNSLMMHKNNMFENSLFAPYLLPVEQLLKLNKQVQYLNTIKKIEIHNIEFPDNLITNFDFGTSKFPDFNKKIDHMQKLQKEVLISFKHCNDFLYKWLNSPLKNYVSIQRKYNGKIFQEYEQEMEQYLKLLQ